jgi:hypothetical protein
MPFGVGARIPRIWYARGVGSVLAAATFGLGSWLASLRTFYGVHSPLKPDQVLGRTVPYQFRSFVVFITQAERSKLDTLETWAWTSAAVTLAFFVVSEWILWVCSKNDLS